MPSFSQKSFILLSAIWISTTLGSPDTESSGGQPRRVTNANRFARGLPPLAPRRLYGGSKVGSAHHARASPNFVPSPFSRGIHIYDSAGRAGDNELGWLNTNEWSFSPTTDCSSALLDPTLQSDLGLINPTAGSPWPNIGFVDYFGSESPYSFHWAALAGTPELKNLPVGSMPPWTDNNAFGIEGYTASNIWDIDNIGELSANWVNRGGSTTATRFVYSAHYDQILAGPITSSPSTLYSDAIVVRLYLETFSCIPQGD